MHQVALPQSVADFGALGASLQSAILRFQSEGITHVIITDVNASLTLLFTRAADGQGYRPRYGVTSQNGGSTVAALAPPGQLDRAVGIGWIPAFDVLAVEVPPNPAFDQCLATMAAAGEQPADTNNAVVMGQICEQLWLLDQAIEAGAPDVTADRAIAGLESLGGSAPSLSSFTNVFGPNRHDGAGTYRTVAYDPACTCFHYTSEPRSAQI